ncbi:hypothetical protein Cgig2_023435 [Carnegiea gigantea]|uniref:Uncharacterized protein n=1 Tax=Carnegiea gigantea TaxID=171969 RepID=A0A9Q1GKJ1_9CARY|nr:hypothetical protein Cgig2_023435 [Carnegiea gigantea]
MSTCIPTASASVPAAGAEATASIAAPSFSLRRRRFQSNSNGLLALFSNSNSNSIPKLRLFSQSPQSAVTCAVAAKTLLNNAGMDGSSSAAVSQSNSETSAQEVKNGKPSVGSADMPLASEDSVSEFITQVAGLVKLVDSRDIVELQLKQHDCELLIRKKEAIAPAAPAPVIMMQSPPPAPVAPQATAAVSLLLCLLLHHLLHLSHQRLSQPSHQFPPLIALWLEHFIEVLHLVLHRL